MPSAVRGDGPAGKWQDYYRSGLTMASLDPDNPDASFQQRIGNNVYYHVPQCYLR
jgi:hypothetical protein